MHSGSSEERNANLEELFHGLDVPSIGQEQNDVIAFFDNRVVVGHDDIIAAHDGANGGAFGQIDCLYRATDHLEVSLSPCAMASIASAAPRRNE